MRRLFFAIVLLAALTNVADATGYGYLSNTSQARCSTWPAGYYVGITIGSQYKSIASPDGTGHACIDTSGDAWVYATIPGTQGNELWAKVPDWPVVKSDGTTTTFTGANLNFYGCFPFPPGIYVQGSYISNPAGVACILGGMVYTFAANAFVGDGRPYLVAVTMFTYSQ